MSIEKKVALVTGGANGIGFAYAKELLRNGAKHVAILDLANSNGEEAASKLNKEFGQGKAIFIICDVTKPQELEAGFAKTVEAFGGLDIVINNAGICDDLRWELEINVNCNGVVRGTLLGMQYMGKDKGGNGGTIVNISSYVGILPAPSFPIYAATKHAVVGFSRAFGDPYHYERTGVRILILCPGATETQLMTSCPDRMLDIYSKELMINNLKKYPSQSADSVAHCLVHILKVGTSGSVWFVEGAETYEIELPKYPFKRVQH